MKSQKTDERIKEKAKQLFLSYGLKSVSMDDIAHLSGVSKKSIYQYFEDKSALVRLIVNDLIRAHERLFETSRTTAQDAVDEVLKQDTEQLEILAPIRHSFCYDLKKFFPEVWEEIEQYKLRLFKSIILNLEWGMKEGIYRNDINTIFVADLRLYQLMNCLQPQLVATQKWDLERVLLDFTRLYLHGITTEKGGDLLQTYWKIYDAKLNKNAVPASGSLHSKLRSL
jgi:AcrR family transcriptional regulator